MKGGPYPKWEWRKEQKALYGPPAEPVAVDVPEMAFFVIEGSGAPDRPEFGREIGALYALSYTAKMWPMKDPAPPDYVDCPVFPLEGVWDLAEWARAPVDAEGRRPLDKAAFRYAIMIRQPPYVTDAFAAQVVERAAAKVEPAILAHVRFERRTEGPCVQMLHIGPYDAEPASFARMEAFCAERGLARTSMAHREIYLSDPGRSKPETMRTALRFGVRPAG